MSRRQAKLAARAAERAALAGEKRPFAGFTSECDLIAMQEFVPAATAAVPGTNKLVIASILPGIAGKVTTAGTRLVSLQLAVPSNRQGQTLASQIAWAKDAAPGAELASPQPSELSLADVLDPATQLDITVETDYSFWFDADEQASPEIQQLLERANDMLFPSERVNAAVPGAAWWVDPGDKAHIRWVHPADEDALLDALARIHAAGELHLGEDSKFAGVFRTHGVLVPVFDLDNTISAPEWVPGLETLHGRVEAALAATEPLTAAQRSSKETIISRQVTIR